MVGIEYSPNNRAHCQKCHGKIKKGSVRVSAMAASSYGSRGEYTKQYTHAECYTGRKDFTKFYGYRDLWPDDQKRFMSEKQKRENYPQDYIDKKDVVMSNKVDVTFGTTTTAVSSSANVEFEDGIDDEELATFDLDAACKQRSNKQSSSSTSSNAMVEPQQQPQKETAKVYCTGVKVLMFGLKSAHARAVPGEKVSLVRDPDNVSIWYAYIPICVCGCVCQLSKLQTLTIHKHIICKISKMYDSRAIKVTNSSNLRVGYITRTVAYPISNELDKFKAKFLGKSKRLEMIGTILDAGDGSKQTLQVGIKVTNIETKLNQSNANLGAATNNTSSEMATQSPKVFTIVGLRYAEARASYGENVTLIREPENVSACVGTPIDTNCFICLNITSFSSCNLLGTRNTISMPSK